MKLCPHCQTVFSDDEFFCTSDGTPLLENYNKLEENPNPTALYPQFDNNPPPNSFNPQPPTVQYGQQNSPSLGEVPTIFIPPQTPQFQPPQTEPNSKKNVIIAVLATTSVFLLIGMVFLLVNNYLISKETEIKPVANTEREGSSTEKSNNSNSENNTGTSNINNDKQGDVADKEKKKDEESNLSTPVKKPNDINQIMPNGISQQYSGSSRFPNKTLPLTLSLIRNGQRLSGSAQTPDDYDDLSGTIQSDGSFYLKGYNAKFGRVTGIWSGKISESGQVSGVWTSTIDGSKVRFSAR